MKKKMFAWITAVLLLTTIAISSNSSFLLSEAGHFCPDMGSNMDRSSVVTLGILRPDEPNRKWTVEELFANSIKFTSYYGEGEGDWIFANKVDRGAGRDSSWGDPTVQDNVKSARNLSCIFGNGDFLPNIGLTLASGLGSLVSKTVTMLISNDFLTEGVMKIIGGAESQNDGLISIFFNSLYMPLVVLSFLFAAVTLVYKGLVKRQLREALSSLIWSTVAFVVGVTLMFIPTFMVSVPQAATSTITTCVLGALNGENCLTGATTARSGLLVGTECLSKIEGDTTPAETLVNGMGCTIWKSFVLDPWAEEQFGKPYSQLYTKNPPEGEELWDGLDGEDGAKYCVNLASSKSAKESKKNVVMDRNDDSTVCNIALYQLYLMTNMDDTVNHSGDGYSLTSNGNSDKPYDARWFDIISPMAKHSSDWNNWSGQSKLISRIGSATLMLFSVSAAGLVFIVLSVFGSAYKMTGIIMMAFAPLFLLLAVEPNRGRKIFLGWLETLVSSILKYFAITLLIVVALTLYAGVLSSISGVMASFVSVLILTAAMLMYRKEITDIIGLSNMGGQKFSNKTAESLDWTKKQAVEKGTSALGGSIGGALGAESSRRNEIKNREKNISDLQNQLARATSENRSEDSIVIQKALNEEEANLRDLKSVSGKTKAIAEGISSGASDSINRTMRRGTSATATVFKQQKATKTALDRKYKDMRGQYDTIPEADLDDAINPKRENTDNSTGNKGGPTASKPNSDNKLHPREREDVAYEGELTKEEIEDLDIFAKKLSEILTDEEMSTYITSENLSDINKSRIIKSELNARIKFNTQNGNANHPALYLDDLANPENLSTPELMMSINIARDDYVENGDLKQADKYKLLGGELQRRNIMDTQKVHEGLLSMAEERKVVEETGASHPRINETKEELQAIYKNNRENYNNILSKFDNLENSSEPTVYPIMREEIEYEGDLSERRIKELDDFANHLTNIPNDGDLIKTISKEDRGDENIKKIISNELNSRIEANTKNGQVNHPGLLLEDLANPEHFSSAELMLGLETIRDDFVSEGDLRNIDKLNLMGAELQKRGTLTEEELEGKLSEMVLYREIAQEAGQIVPRETSTKGELEEMFQKDKKRYETLLINYGSKNKPQETQDTQKPQENKKRTEDRSGTSKKKENQTSDLNKKNQSKVKNEPQKTTKIDEVKIKSTRGERDVDSTFAFSHKKQDKKIEEGSKPKSKQGHVENKTASPPKDIKDNKSLKEEKRQNNKQNINFKDTNPPATPNRQENVTQKAGQKTHKLPELKTHYSEHPNNKKNKKVEEDYNIREMEERETRTKGKEIGEGSIKMPPIKEEFKFQKREEVMMRPDLSLGKDKERD